MERQTVSDSDFKPSVMPPILSSMKSKHIRWLVPALCLLSAILLFIIMPNSSQATRSPPAPVGTAPSSARDDTAATITLPLALPQKPATATQPAAAAPLSTPPAPSDRQISVTVRRGDNLSDIFSHNGISARDLQLVMSAGGMRPGSCATCIREIPSGSSRTIRAICYPWSMTSTGPTPLNSPRPATDSSPTSWNRHRRTASPMPAASWTLHCISPQKSRITRQSDHGVGQYLRLGHRLCTGYTLRRCLYRALRTTIPERRKDRRRGHHRGRIHQRGQDVPRCQV